jgi:hypothetical protein
MFPFLTGEQAVERLVTNTMMQFKRYIAINSVIGGQCVTFLIQPSHCALGFPFLAPEFSG